MLKILGAVFDYLLIPFMILWASIMMGGLWWSTWTISDDPDPRVRLGQAIFVLLALDAFVYESGYKRYYRAGRKRYFYVVYIAPVCFALVGFVYGFWVVEF